jgi:nicotinamide-nucleotide amidase
VTVELLNIGTELLLGEVVNTHAAWIGKRLFPLGLRIARQTTVPDGPGIRAGFFEAFPRAEILIATGGLGPTTDDITRETLAEILGLRLRADAGVRADLESLLAARGFTLRERMLRQTLVPEGCRVLRNPAGTAPGLYLPPVHTPSWCSPHVFLLPGPPRELQPMFDNEVLPFLETICGGLERRECRVYRIVGLGESAVEEMIGLELSRRGDLEVGYCARPNEVDFRLIGARDVLDALEPRLLDLLGDHVVSSEGENLESRVVGLLGSRSWTLSTAESCTGGHLANRITDVPGASAVFREGFVTYSNEAKTRLLGVPPGLLREHGAVSRPVAIAMAEGARDKAGADAALSLTGIAGPDGGSPEKPVGTLFIALALKGEASTVCQAHRFVRDRGTFKQLASQAALDLLRRRLITQ